jgi:hypothetical protein
MDTGQSRHTFRGKENTLAMLDTLESPRCAPLDAGRRKIRQCLELLQAVGVVRGDTVVVGPRGGLICVEGENDHLVAFVRPARGLRGSGRSG